MQNYLEVRAQVTLLHCSTTGGWCLQLASISLAVFQYGGVGKQRAHANSHTSNRTAINFSASFSATPTAKRMNIWKQNCHLVEKKNIHPAKATLKLKPLHWSLKCIDFSFLGPIFYV